MLGGEHSRPRYVPHAALRRLHLVVGVLGALWFTTSAGLLFSWRRYGGRVADSPRSEHRVKELTNEVVILRKQLVSMALSSSGPARVGGGRGGSSESGGAGSAARHMEEAEQVTARLRSMRPDKDTDGGALGSPSSSGVRIAPELSVRRRAAGQQPEFRVAMIIPWLGPSFPRWFPLFVASCAGSDHLVDWLVFHEDASLDESISHIPPNVYLHPLGQHGMGALFGVQLARLTGAENQTHTHVRLLQHAFATWPYAITEYKPVYGDVFAGTSAPQARCAAARVCTAEPPCAPGLTQG